MKVEFKAIYTQEEIVQKIQEEWDEAPTPGPGKFVVSRYYDEYHVDFVPAPKDKSTEAAQPEPIDQSHFVDLGEEEVK